MWLRWPPREEAMINSPGNLWLCEGQLEMKSSTQYHMNNTVSYHLTSSQYRYRYDYFPSIPSLYISMKFGFRDLPLWVHRILFGIFGFVVACCLVVVGLSALTFQFPYGYNNPNALASLKGTATSTKFC
jgi:hypothetical protein